MSILGPLIPVFRTSGDVSSEFHAFMKIWSSHFCFVSGFNVSGSCWKTKWLQHHINLYLNLDQDLEWISFDSQWLSFPHCVASHDSISSRDLDSLSSNKALWFKVLIHRLDSNQGSDYIVSLTSGWGGQNFTKKSSFGVGFMFSRKSRCVIGNMNIQNNIMTM